MQYDLNGNRIYGEFTDHFGQKLVIKKASDNSVVEGAVQLRLGGNELAMYVYPTRETVPGIIDALTAFMADTDGIPDLPESGE